MARKKPDNPEEAYLLGRLREIFGPDAVQPRAEQGDVQTPRYQWEHKYRNTSGFTVQKDHWMKISARAAQRDADPVLVIRNKDRQRLAVVELDVLLRLIKAER